MTADVLGGVTVGREALLIHEQRLVTDQVVRVPVVVHAAESELWFPTFRGELRFSPDAADSDVTNLSLVGVYEPPFGPAGEVLDALVTHRIATSTLHALLEQVATTLATAVPFEDGPST